MKLQKWILEGSAIGGDESNPMIIYTSPDATRETAYRKMCHIIPENQRCFIRLKRSSIINREARNE